MKVKKCGNSCELPYFFSYLFAAQEGTIARQ